MSKFKAGDKVRVVDGGGHLPEGKEYTVERIDSEGDLWLDNEMCSHPWRVELVDQVGTKSKDSRTNMEITIDNLRELARHAEKWDKKRFDMREFRQAISHWQDDYSIRSQRQFIEPDPECGTSCCLIGIADAEGMGADIPDEYYSTYAKKLFPALDICAINIERNKLFGTHLKSKLKRRVKALRLAANMLEMHGEIDYSKLPD